MTNTTHSSVQSSLKLISLLLDYPEERDKAQVGEFLALLEGIAKALALEPAQITAMQELIHQRYSNELMDAQERYLSLFDQGRYLSLLMFEHVHGESRDRGQAMVDLLAQYEAAGLAITAKELPDYIPLYLEYLSGLEAEKAVAGLREIEHLLALLAARLQEKEAPYTVYAVCFEVLLRIALGSTERVQEALNEIREQMEQGKQGKPSSNTDLAALDEQWEEEAVTFMQPIPNNTQSSTQQNFSIHRTRRGTLGGIPA